MLIKIAPQLYPRPHDFTQALTQQFSKLRTHHLDPAAFDYLCMHHIPGWDKPETVSIAAYGTQETGEVVLKDVAKHAHMIKGASLPPNDQLLQLKAVWPNSWWGPECDAEDWS